MSDIIKTIAEETGGKSYKTHKLCLDRFEIPSLDYDDHQEIVWKAYGETERYRTPINLSEHSKKIENVNPIFTYFLDGSRRTYKIDDISYSNRVFPIVAGQIGVGCCKRENKKLKKYSFARHIVITLPNKAYSDGWSSDLFYNNLLKKINNLKFLQKHNIKFDDIIEYTFSKDDKKNEDKAVAKIQERMVNLEIELVSNLTKQKCLSNKNYLIKDGSLEYRIVEPNSKRSLNEIKNNYRWVVGVSKSFNPERCIDHSGTSNSDYIANLKPFHRTPVYMYESSFAGNVSFAIWYVRLRDSKFSFGPFEGIIKVEKILVTEDEINNGLDSEEVDLISANLINERNPVCYGSDTRWENHLYPVYLTEKYVKSNYLSTKHFLNLF